MKLILASESWIRRDVLNMLNVDFEVVPSHFDEDSVQRDDPLELVEVLSEKKAMVVAQKEPEAVIIAADTLIVCHNKLYGKPKSIEKGIQMLTELSGQTFSIINGLTVLNSKTGNKQSCKTELQVTFRILLKKEIEAYCRRIKVTTVAAAFDNEGLLRFTKTLHGDLNYNGGMPIGTLIEFLRNENISL